MMASNAPMSSCFDLVKNFTVEAVAYVRVEFRFVGKNGTYIIHESECGLYTQIGGLKEDLSDVIEIPAAEQTWYHNGELMEDDKFLIHYDIDCKYPRNPKIIVRFKNNSI